MTERKIIASLFQQMNLNKPASSFSKTRITKPSINTKELHFSVNEVDPYLFVLIHIFNTNKLFDKYEMAVNESHQCHIQYKHAQQMNLNKPASSFSKTRHMALTNERVRDQY